MRLLKCIIFSLIFATGALAEALKAPTSADLSLLSAAISNQLLDPESIRLSDVIAAPDPVTSSMDWVCGSVQGKNGFGGYAQPAPFIAMLVNDPFSGERIVQVLKVAGDEVQENLVVELCRKKFDFVVAVYDAGPALAGHLKDHSKMSFFCSLEGNGSAPCSQRDSLALQLNQLGWCLGQKTTDDWHQCTGQTQ